MSIRSEIRTELVFFLCDGCSNHVRCECCCLNRKNTGELDEDCFQERVYKRDFKQNACSLLKANQDCQAAPGSQIAYI